MTIKPQKYNIYEIFLNCQSGKLLIVDDKMILVVIPDKKIESSKTCINTLERLDPQKQNNQFKLYDKQLVCGK